MSKKISTKIKEFREALGLSQSRFSSSIGILNTTLSNYELDVSTPKNDFYSKIKLAYPNACMDYFFSEEGEMFLIGSKPEVPLTPIKVKEVKPVAEFEKTDVSLYQKLVNSLEDRCKELSEQVTYFREQNKLLIAK